MIFTLFGWTRPMNCLKLNMYQEQAVSRYMTYLSVIICGCKTFHVECWLVMCRTNGEYLLMLPRYSSYYYDGNFMELLLYVWICRSCLVFCGLTLDGQKSGIEYDYKWLCLNDSNNIQSANGDRHKPPWIAERGKKETWLCYIPDSLNLYP